MKFSISDPGKHKTTLAYSYVRLQSLSAIENGRPRIPPHLCFIHTRISAPSINLLETTQLPLYV